MRDVWAVGFNVLRTTLDAATGTIRAWLGDAISGARETDDAEWWQTPGVVTRPVNAIKGRPNYAVETVILRKGSRDIVIAARDPLGQKLAATLAPGESCFYAPGPDGTGQARLFFKTGSVIALYTTDAEGGDGMTILLDPGTDVIRLTNMAGHGFIVTADGVKIVVAGGAAGISVNADGTASLIATRQAQVDGGSIVIGSIAIPVVNAALRGPAGLAGTPSAKVLIE